MTINTPQKYRDDIKAIGEKITVNYNTYCRTIPLLESAGVVIPSYSNSLAEAIQQGINAYVRSVCKQVSNAYQGETTRIFTMADLRFTGSELPPLFSPYSSNTSKEHSDEFVLTKILNHFDFDKFVSELTRHASTLEARGKADIGEYLCGAFSLRADYRDDIIKRTAQHYSFNRNHQAGWRGKYEHGMSENILRLVTNVTAAAKELDAPALIPSFTMLCEAISSGNVTVPSGTTFGCKNTVLIKVFKEHIRFSLTPEMMDVIVTYIKIYAPKVNLCELPQAA
jgi:hypothetical protein